MVSGMVRMIWIAAGGGDEGQGDAGVAAGGFDENGFAGGDFPGLFGVVDHGEADAVLDGGQRIEEFELEVDARRGSRRPSRCG
jgi:hypothetical protein